MRNVIKEGFSCNSGGVVVNGRGVMRRKLTASERDQLAVDLALRRATPALSIKQAADFVGSPPHRVAAGIKREDREAAARVALIEEAEAMDRQIDAATTAVDNLVADIESSSKPRITRREFKLHERVKNGILMARSVLEKNRKREICTSGSGAARLAAIPAGESPANRGVQSLL